MEGLIVTGIRNQFFGDDKKKSDQEEPDEQQGGKRKKKLPQKEKIRQELKILIL